ncbi:hypothetical protein HS088_TW15G00240 [Tripterygium wilfordii]|uniref:RING-type E3 ubiquitin transferase n=1 Tax=Tripterygium wilfordii TaxID=458696 RepID=A0A7J7CL22_TRIWF|nr:U-box domain-containing protein 19-like [Tripterygium wilfordii]KAF5734748.1 hypothetical protein HS088_TW15G00240 [Tripterygium wilfordii]
MIGNFNRIDRRILSFPAVHPCEGIAPATLLRSLIILSHNICNHQSKFFATQHRNSRETIRKIGVLLIFFEEIRDRGLTLSDSTVLCFSEFHINFQKILFLLEDCASEGARLWMLMKSEFVATQFMVLIRSIATALDVLPLTAIHVSGEVKELVELVGKQARKARLEVECEDQCAMKLLLSMLNQFEKGIEPDLRFMKRVLDYIEIKSWKDCNKEIEFLQEEIDLQYSDYDNREVAFLSSLVAFLSYCRVIMFETLDYRKKNPPVVKCQMETLGCLIPEDIRCPISLELMTDPVTLSTGQTYDRSSIQRWLEVGNKTCPRTGEKLTNIELLPNTTLRKLIQQFCLNNGISQANSGNRCRDITRTIVPGSPAGENAAKFLSRFLSRRLVFGTNDQKNKAAYEIRLLAKSNIYNRSCLIEAGAVLSLLNLITSSEDHFMQENAISALLKLSKYITGKEEIIENGGLKSILAVLKQGLTLESRQIAAAIVFYLSSMKQYRELIGETPGLISGLVELIKDGTTCGKKNAVASIFVLLNPGNHQRVIEAGTVPLLVDILVSSDKSELVEDSLAVLAGLAESFNGTLAVLETPALTIITRILQSLTITRAAKEYCVSIMLSLCKFGGVEVIAALAKETSLMASLYSIITNGTSHATRKARALIKILHQFHKTSTSSEFIDSAASLERPVHVR